MVEPYISLRLAHHYLKTLTMTYNQEADLVVGGLARGTCVQKDVLGMRAMSIMAKSCELNQMCLFPGPR